MYNNEKTLSDQVAELEHHMEDLIYQYEACAAEHYHWASVAEQIEDSRMDAEERHWDSVIEQITDRP